MAAKRNRTEFEEDGKLQLGKKVKRPSCKKLKDFDIKDSVDFYDACLDDCDCSSHPTDSHDLKEFAYSVVHKIPEDESTELSSLNNQQHENFAGEQQQQQQEQQTLQSPLDNFLQLQKTMQSISDLFKCIICYNCTSTPISCEHCKQPLCFSCLLKLSDNPTDPKPIFYICHLTRKSYWGSPLKCPQCRLSWKSAQLSYYTGRNDFVNLRYPTAILDCLVCKKKIKGSYLDRIKHVIECFRVYRDKKYSKLACNENIQSVTIYICTMAGCHWKSKSASSHRQHVELHIVFNHWQRVMSDMSEPSLHKFLDTAQRLNVALGFSAAVYSPKDQKLFEQYSPPPAITNS
jgi:hypothetical protein